MGDLISSALPGIALSAALFIFLWAFLGNFLFKPFFSLLEQREARTTGDRKDAQEMRKESEKVMVQIETELRAARLAGIRHRDEEVKVARARAQAIIEEESEKAQRKLEAARSELARQRAEVRAVLERESQGLAASLIEKVLRNSPPARPTVH